ncbi:MAG: NADH:ubiquinone reductase (Na(+)-transporting) subunit C [Gammaproteobacteria bacterium]|nr:NADH:ubiquinone reductase (Na(+)-transporting) subunit C [Gammaproteobacteria bacterium]
MSDSRDSIANTFLVAIGVSLVCSVLVSAAAVLLQPLQEQNERLYRQQIVLEVAGLYEPGIDIEERFAAIDSERVELAGGDAAEVFVVRDGGAVEQVILPVSGPGLWSTMYGYLSLEADGSTVRGLRFYEHAETPGLGDQVEKADWLAKWPGKQLFDANGDVRIEVVRGQVADSDNAIYQVDGMSGATLTGRGVTALLHHWAGPLGFGPYLQNISSEAAGDE